MALIAPQSIRRSGLEGSFSAPGASDTFVPGERIFYYAKVGVTATTFTFVVPTSRDVITDVDISNLVVGPKTSKDVLIGPFPAEVFADPTTGLVTVTTDQQTNVTVAVFSLTH